MSISIFEFKATVPDLAAAEKSLQSLHPVFKGEDHQVDTYFNVAKGRLKLREGNIENALIWYDRANEAGNKLSNVLLYKHRPDPGLKEILTQANGIKAVVDKRRKIYFIENVKFHFDQVKDLGAFMEVEAIDESGNLGLEFIRQQCEHYAHFFSIKASDYISHSYSDLIMRNASRDYPEAK
jgi:adenylate cyclase class 2